MHNWAKTIMECVKTKIDTIGLDNIDGEHLCELEKWTCIAEKIAEYDYYYHITEAMEKPENQYGVNYDENGRYYTPMRSENGRYMSRGRGRRGYEEEYDPKSRHMEHYRDIDYMDGRMYYTESEGMNMGSSNGRRSYSDSRYETARRGYEESKAMTPDDDSKNMKAMESIFDVLEGDIKELKPKMSMTEKNFAKTKLNGMANMLV